MRDQNTEFSFCQKITVVILAILVVVNVAWAVMHMRPGILVALIIYAFAIFLCLKQKDFRAGIIIGAIGFLIHVVELIFRGIAWLGRIESAFFIINLILPLILVLFSYKAYRDIKRG